MDVRFLRSGVYIGASLIVAGLLMGGCGDDHDSSSSSCGSATEAIRGLVIDGYIRGAKVCLDRNLNFVCDSDEPTTTSSSGGRFTLYVSPSELNSYPLVGEATSDSFDEGRNTYFTKSLKLAAPSGEVILTPITTLVQGEIYNGMSRGEAEIKIANSLGIERASIYKDYEADNDTAMQTKAYELATNLQDSGNDVTSVINTVAGSNAFTVNAYVGGNPSVTDWQALTGSSASSTAVIKTQGSKGTATINNGVLTYTPDSDKSGSDTIVITITEADGTSRDVTITFAGIDTLVAPTISGTYPSSGATDVGPYTWIDINFSKPMDSATMTAANITLSGGKACQKIEYVGGDGNTTRCYPYVTTASHKLNDSTGYTVSISTGVKDTLGTAMSSAATLTFTTGITNKLSRLRTGQSTSYVDYDDAWYADVANAGLGIERTFTRDGANDIVTDDITGLMWQDNNLGASVNWTTATGTTCQALALGGQGDWRLPTIEESVSILDKERGSSPATFNTFINVDNNYWSSTTYLPSPTLAWFTDNAMSFGRADADGKVNSRPVRCVRSDSSSYPHVYIRAADKDIVLDASSGLMWQDDDTTDTTSAIWADAITVCENLELGGYTDWRLPNFNELFMLGDRSTYAPAMSPVFEHTKNISGYYHWSSTTYKGNTAQAFMINLYNGPGTTLTSATKASSSNHVRCVRGGL